MLHPFIVVARLEGDADWFMPHLRMHKDAEAAANAASDFLREQLTHLGISRNLARAHVTAPRARMRQHPDTPVSVSLPGQNAPLLHLMVATIAVPAVDHAENPPG